MPHHLSITREFNLTGTTMSAWARLDPGMLSDSELVTRKVQAQAIADDIRTQIECNNLALVQQDRQWGARAARARKLCLADVQIYEEEIARRRERQLQANKTARNEANIRMQQTQHALFVRYMAKTMSKEQFAVLWANVRQMFPDDPAWRNGKDAAA